MAVAVDRGRFRPPCVANPPSPSVIVVPRSPAVPRAGTVVTMAASTDSTAAELATIADNVGQYRARVAAIAEIHIGTDRDDLVGAIHEAERQLRVAERGLARAIRAAR